MTIAEMRALHDKATPGPWKWAAVPLPDGSADEGTMYGPGLASVITGAVHCAAMMDAADAALIAAMRDALPALLDAAEAAKRLADAMQTEHPNINWEEYNDVRAAVARLETT